MRSAITLSLLLVLACITACEPKENNATPAVNPTIVFVADSGYTFRDDTVGTGETLKVGVEIAKGTDAMHHFKVTVSYDGGPPQVTDSLPVGVDRFDFEKVMITRDQPGTEKWRFSVTENDGDVIGRSVLITVQ